MDLLGPYFDALVELMKNAFDRKALQQLVRSSLQEDMYKEWVNPNQNLKDDLKELLPKLADLGLLAILLDRVAIERAHLQEQLSDLRAALDIKTTSTQDQTDAISSGVASVANKLQFPAVRAIVSQSKTVLTELAAKITLLGAYKNLHDELHDARMQFRRLQTTAKPLGKDPDAVVEFTEAVMLMEAVDADIGKIHADLPTHPNNVREEEGQWIIAFSEAVNLARQAADNGDPVMARQSLQGIRRVLNIAPSSIDTRLGNTAKGLDLAKLKNVFTAAAEVPELSKDAEMLRQGGMATEQLLLEIKAQVTQHANWQAIDRALDSSDEHLKNLAEDTVDFDGVWRGLKLGIQPLMAADLDSQWAKKVSASLTQVETTRAAADWPKLTVAFSRFRQDATTQFVAIDKKLKKLAESVNTLGEPLRNLLAKP